MNYDLCDLLNRKLENVNGYLQDFPNRSLLKNQNVLDEILENVDSDLYVKILDSEFCNHECFGFWIYRNGKISNQIDDFDESARRITKELANLSYSNNPSLDVMYFGGMIKVLVSLDKSIYIETCIRPSLDQMMTLKDMEIKFLVNNGKSVWRVCERRKKQVYWDGIGLNDLHAFKWSRIK
jgi:hypothetical protein